MPQLEFTITDQPKRKHRVQRIHVSRLARETGYNKSHVSRVFAKETMPSLRCANSLATALGLSLEDFLTMLRIGTFRVEGKPKRRKVKA